MIEEINILIAQLENKKQHCIEGYYFYEGKIKEKWVVIGLSGIGEVAAALCVYIGVKNFTPYAILNIGCCGSHSEDLTYGNIILVDKIYGKATFEIEFDSVSQYIATDNSLKEVIEKAFIENKIEYIMGDIVSADLWNKVDSIACLNSKYESLGEEMESYGECVAAEITNTPYCAIKVVSNNELKEEEYDISVMNNFQIDILKIINSI